MLTTDNYMTDGLVQTIQALKFNKVGDFNYMIYASRNKKVQKATASDHNI